MKNLFGEEEPKEVWVEESPTVFRVDSLGSSTKIVDMTEDEKARLLIDMVRASNQIYENTCRKLGCTAELHVASRERQTR